MPLAPDDQVARRLVDKLSAGQLNELADRLPRANPMELDRLLGAFAQSTDDAVGLKLLDVLGSAELRGTLTVDAIRPSKALLGTARSRN